MSCTAAVCRGARWAVRSLPGAAFAVMLGCAVSAQLSSQPYVKASSPEEAGRYLILVGGCNDCHTPGWDRSSGRLPASEWLTGNDVGYRGPWGTSYAPNLRRSVHGMSEEEWVKMFRAGAGLPPMPWLNYTTMHERDLVAMYRFIKSLGVKGDPAPGALPPGEEPRTPYVLMVPQRPAGARP